MIAQLQKQYCILAQVDLNPWHKETTISRTTWLTRIMHELHRPVFEQDQRIVFTLSIGDLYDNELSETGVFIREFQLCLNSVDISNYFVILITSDMVLKTAYENTYQTFSTDTVPITIIIDPEMTYQKQIKPAKVDAKPGYNYNGREPLKIDINTLDLRKQELLMNSKTFCMYPWIHLHAYPTGNAYPCCMADMKHPLGSTKKNTLKEIWNQEPMRQVRCNMLENKEVEACGRCYEQEEAGFLSGRLSANKHHGHLIDRIDNTQENGQLDQFELTYWDIRFSNLCNLSCRSCGHIFSSSWYQDQAKLAGGDWKEKNKVLNYAGRTETDIWEQLEPHLDYVEQIYFAGGEPLLMEEHYRILDELVRRKRFDVRLLYNTNFTHTDLKGRSVFEYWKQFKSVAVGASLDDSGSRGEYIRKGTDWAVVEQNRRDMLAICPEVDFYISPTLSIMNARHLPEFHRNWVEKGLIRAQDLNVNILQDPPHYRIDIATAEYKAELTDLYAQHLDWLNTQGDSLGRVTQGFESAITFMNTIDNTHLLDTFWRKTHELDAIRNENCLDIIPELRALK
jgi:MoaA/NifB/PqqE/SkfB family radical SAM enzyme